MHSFQPNLDAFSLPEKCGAKATVVAPANSVPPQGTIAAGVALYMVAMR